MTNEQNSSNVDGTQPMITEAINWIQKFQMPFDFFFVWHKNEASKKKQQINLTKFRRKFFERKNNSSKQWTEWKAIITHKLICIVDFFVVRFVFYLFLSFMIVVTR